MKYKQRKVELERVAATKKRAKADAFKQVFEFLKHMTTMSSGSILLLVTFMEKILKGAGTSKSVGLAFFGFCVSILAALATMFFLSLHRDETVSDSEANFFAWTLMLAVMGFFIGICSLAYTAYPWF